MMASLITVRRATELSFNCCPFVRLYHVCNGNQPHRMSDYLLTGGKDQFVGENETSSFKVRKNDYLWLFSFLCLISNHVLISF